jgi:hypothetical protein
MSQAVGSAAILAIACLISYSLITNILTQEYSVSRFDDLLGGLWAVVATIFVFRNSYQKSARAALSRTLATLLSFAICLAYLLFFPFHVVGMAILIGIERYHFGRGSAIRGHSSRLPLQLLSFWLSPELARIMLGFNPFCAWSIQPWGFSVGIAASWKQSSRRPDRLRPNVSFTVFCHPDNKTNRLSIAFPDLPEVSTPTHSRPEWSSRSAVT